MRFRDWPLWRKLVVLVLVAAGLPVGVGAVVSFLKGRELLERQVATSLAVHADGVAEQLDAFNAHWADQTAMVAQLPAVAEHFGGAPAPDAEARLGRLLSGLVGREPRLRVASVFGADGTVEASSLPEAVGVKAGFRAYVRDALAGTTVVGYVVTARFAVEGEPLVVYAVPVRGASGEVRGALALFVRGEALWALAGAANDGAWPGSYVVVQDGDGVRLAHGVRPEFVFHPARRLDDATRDAFVAEGRFGEQTAALLDAVVPGPAPAEWARLTAGERSALVEIEATWASGGRRLGVLRRTRGAPWTVLSVVPLAAVDAPVDELVAAMLWRSLLAVLLGFAAAGLFARATFRPLTGLIAASTALGRGEQPAPLPVDRRDELGRLVERFNEMMAAVAEARTRLEERVRERTGELERANEELRAQQAELSAQTEELRAQQDTLLAQGRQLEEKNREVERANQLKSSFLANMSHELRTPLNSIIGFSELLDEELGPALGQTHRKYLEDVRASGRHLLGLINDILDLSKIEAGHLELALEAVPAQAALAEALDVVRGAARGREIRLEVGARSGRAVRADVDKLRQVLVNLLSNAVKFSPTGSTVTVSAEDAGEQVRFSVRDQGPGIAPSLLPRLFEPFVQGEDPLVKRHQGTGLGLAICRRLVERHGGRLEVQTAPGAGAAFSFALAVATEPVPARAPGTRPVVLLIEPHAERAKALRERLADGGFDVAAPLEGEASPAAARRVGPRVIVLSPVVNGHDGLRVLAELRRDTVTRRLPLVLTAAPHAVGVLAKPLEPEEVAEVVRRALSERAPAETPASVLVVDDDERARALLTAVLEPRGYRVRAVAGGAEALEALKAAPADVVITDLMMPGLSGFELVERLAAEPSLRAVPVIVLTALELTLEERDRLKRHVFATAKKGDVTAAEVVAAVQRAVRREDPAGDDGPLVLVVDDHDLNRQLARALLERRGYRVLEAEGGAVGVELARRERPALVLMDLAMPGLDGFDALLALKAAPETKGIPVVALTALAMSGDEARARAAGFDDYVTKPVEQAALLAAVERALKGRGR